MDDGVVKGIEKKERLEGEARKAAAAMRVA